MLRARQALTACLATSSRQLPTPCSTLGEAEQERTAHKRNQAGAWTVPQPETLVDLWGVCMGLAQHKQPRRRVRPHTRSQPHQTATTGASSAHQWAAMIQAKSVLLAPSRQVVGAAASRQHTVFRLVVEHHNSSDPRTSTPSGTRVTDETLHNLHVLASVQATPPPIAMMAGCAPRPLRRREASRASGGTEAQARHS